jgi:hypothetical protein
MSYVVRFKRKGVTEETERFQSYDSATMFAVSLPYDAEVVKVPDFCGMHEVRLDKEGCCSDCQCEPQGDKDGD